MERVRKDFDFSVCGVIGNYLIVKQLREESAEARKIIAAAEHLGTEEVGKAKGILMKNLIAMVNAEKMLDMEIKKVAALAQKLGITTPALDKIIT